MAVLSPPNLSNVVIKLLGVRFPVKAELLWSNKLSMNNKICFEYSKCLIANKFIFSREVQRTILGVYIHTIVDYKNILLKGCSNTSKEKSLSSWNRSHEFISNELILSFHKSSQILDHSFKMQCYRHKNCRKCVWKG